MKAGEGGSVSEFFRSALDIIEAGKQMDVRLRLLGATAIYYHCPKSASLTHALDRPLTDIDFVALSKQISRIPELFTQLKFVANQHVNNLYGANRQIYYDPENRRQIDIFFDKLSFNHVLDLSKRLDLDPVTISLSDLLLEKLQIVKMSEKDAKDVIVLLREHGFGSRPTEDIDSTYIAKLLANDWGFYYTVTLNLKKVSDYMKKVDFVSDDEKGSITRKFEELTQRVESEPKSFGWKMRARIGTKKSWYTEAEDVEDRQ